MLQRENTIEASILVHPDKGERLAFFVIIAMLVINLLWGIGARVWAKPDCYVLPVKTNGVIDD